MIESVQAQLRRRYPTMERFKSAILASGSQVRLAKNLGIYRQQITNHMRWLEQNTQEITSAIPTKKICDLRNGELDKRIVAMAGTGYAKVKVYTLKGDYVAGQVMNQEDFVREEISKTALSAWGRVD